MPLNSTLIPGSEQDEDKNIGQRHADRTFSGLSDAERRGTVDTTPGSTNMDDFENSFKNDAANVADDTETRRREHEAGGAPGGWEDNTGQNTSTKKKGRFKGLFKKASPALGVGGILGIGGFVLIGLTSPSLLIVQIKETMLERFNTQLSSMEARSNKLLVSKIEGATSGTCGSKITIRCKFTTMSEKQVNKLKAAGIEVVPDDKVRIAGRVKPTGLTFEGKTIAPKDFTRMANTDPAFRSALKQAYNPKYAGFVGKAWANVAAKFKINKKTPDLGAGADEAKAREKINTIAREGVEDTGGRVRAVASDADCEGSKCITQEQADKMNADAAEVEKGAKDGSAAKAVREKLSGINSGAVTNIFKITGPVDYYCQLYGGVTALTYAAKAIRAAQLVRFAMIFNGMADSIKAGKSPPPEDVALLGSILTTTITDSKDPTKTLVGSATDSFGYRYAAYGDSGGSKQSMSIANRFMAGGGMVGELSAVSTTASSLLGGREGASQKCGFLANPFVQGGSLLLGAAAMLVPGVNVTKVLVSAAAGAAISVGISLLPGLLADIVAGTVTDNIVGEEAGNAFTSGSGALMSDALAAQNGNGPMSKADAIAYNTQLIEVKNQYIADELRDTSPFDPYNPHSFVGSIVASILPAQSSSNPLHTIGSILQSSVVNIIPKSSAVSKEEYAKTLNVCNDPDITDVGYAADPFCNVIRGIPPQYLDKDPVAVIDELKTQGYLDPDTEEPTETYTNFINSCMRNEEPLGYASAESGFDIKAAERCVITNDNVNLYLHFMDTRIELGMSDEDNETTSSAGAAPAAGTSRPENTTDRGGNGGWTLTNNVDYSSAQCDPRTPDAGTYKSPQYGWTIRLCQVTRNTGGGNGNGGNLVNALISTNAMNMFEAFEKETGLRIGLSDGMRKRPPGYFSMHSTGLAMDLGVPRGGSTICYAFGPLWINSREGYGSLARAESACSSKGGDHYKAYQWLRANSQKYGLFNYEKEPWHYSTSGNGT